jgi:hypothetical protein
VGLPHCLDRVTTKFLLRGEPDLDEFPEDVTYHIFEVEKVCYQLMLCNAAVDSIYIHSFVVLKMQMINILTQSQSLPHRPMYTTKAENKKTSPKNTASFVNAP